MSQRTKGPRFYTTSKSGAQFVSEIMSLLMEFGAESFHVQNVDGKVSAIAFQAGGVAYQVAPNVDGVRRRLEDVGRSYVEKAEAVAWAQLRAWVELQLEMIESGVVTAPEAFGGFALTSGGRTVAAMIQERRGELLPGESRLLPSGKGND